MKKAPPQSTWRNTRWNALLQKKCFKRTDVNYRGFQKTVKN
jgi:hypothetical protein